MKIWNQNMAPLALLPERVKHFCSLHLIIKVTKENNTTQSRNGWNVLYSHREEETEQDPASGVHRVPHLAIPGHSQKPAQGICPLHARLRRQQEGPPSLSSQGRIYQDDWSGIIWHTHLSKQRGTTHWIVKHEKVFAHSILDTVCEHTLSFDKKVSQV